MFSKSPFIRVKILNKNREEVSALLDTGSDLSSIESNQLSQKLLNSMEPVVAHTKPCAVEGSEIQFKGKVHLDVRVGGIVVHQHTFYVVDKLVVPYLLGADFQSKLGQFSINWKLGSMRLCDGSNIKFQQNYKSSSASDCLKPTLARVQDTITVPGTSEAAVLCELDHPLDCPELLVEPVHQKDSFISACRMITKLHSPTQLVVRVANLARDPFTLYKGQKLAWANPEFTVSLAHVEGKQKPTVDQGVHFNPEGLTKEQQDSLGTLLHQNADVFFHEGDQLGSVPLVEHTIPLQPGAHPVAQRPRRLSPGDRQEVQHEIQYLLDQGLIETSTSPWASPIVIARRKNGKLRLAIDYRRLNSLTIASHFPLPIIEDILDKLSNARYFSTLDAKNGYYQMRMRYKDTTKTAFVTPDGQYQWTGRGTPFGLSGAAGSFQRLMTAILGELAWMSALAYLDDIIVWSTTWEEHLQRLQSVFDKFRQAGMLLNAEKCQFGRTKIKFLGHVISHDGLEVDRERVSDLLNIPPPSTVTELRKALGAFAYLHRYIPGFCDIAQPLYNLINERKTGPLNWTSEHTEAFNSLKKRVAGAPCLKLPDFSKPFWLVTDASNVGIGAQLAQLDNGLLRPVAYFSRTLRKHERNYNTTNKELLAVVASIKKFRIYLQNPFTLITDHQAIKWLNTTLDPEKEHGRLGRWISYLQSYQFTVHHKPGVSPEIAMADYLQGRS